MAAFGTFGQVNGSTGWFLVNDICYSLEDAKRTHHWGQEKFSNCVIAEIAPDTLKIIFEQQHAEYPFSIEGGMASYEMSDGAAEEEIPFD